MNIEAAWAAGFFDGEGSVGCYYRKDRNSWRLACGITQKDPRVLRRFHAAVHAGTVFGPYLMRGKPMFCWHATTHADIRHVFDVLEPYLDAIKTQQFEQALAAYEEHHENRT